MAYAGGPMTEAMYYVLLALLRPGHGYRLMAAVGEVSAGRVQMGPGTLYGVLGRLLEDGLIEMERADGRRKVYAITDAGRQALYAEYGRLRAMAHDFEQLRAAEGQMEPPEEGSV